MTELATMPEMANNFEQDIIRRHSHKFGTHHYLKNKMDISSIFAQKALPIKLLLTDCDGVLTDNGVYYGADGELMKRFSIRDGMAVERLRNTFGIDVGIVTGEASGSVVKRAEKLHISELHLSVKNKSIKVREIAQRLKLELHEIAYIGDDINDVDIMEIVGLRACPADALPFAQEHADYVCQNKGGNGAFREFAEQIIAAKQKAPKKLDKVLANNRQTK